MAAILVKVFSLGMRTVAKPLGDRVQIWALRHPAVREVAVDAAQKLHSVEVWITRGAAGIESKAFVGQMSDEKAMKLASRVVSEGVVFTVGVSLITWEYLRSRKADAKKKEMEDDRLRLQHSEAEAERQLNRKANTDCLKKIEDLHLRMTHLEERVKHVKG